METLQYDRERGEFYRFAGVSSRLKLAGHAEERGYWRIMIDGKRYMLHHLVWLMENGELPPEQIDHINCNPNDNRIQNLRLATSLQNKGNVRSRNRHGYKGVKLRRDGRWEASIKRRGKSYYLGIFDEIEAAHGAYLRAAEQYFGEYARAA